MCGSLPVPALCLVTDIKGAGGQERMLNVIRDAVRGGVDIVQIREKYLGSDELGEFAKQAVASANGALTFVNGNAEVASFVKADGVHLPEDSPPHHVPEGLLVGRSVHSLESCVAAEIADTTDFLIMGSVFPTDSHKGSPTCGLGALKVCVKSVSIPILGIGGVHAGNARSVMETGVAGVAVQRALIGSNNPLSAAKALKREMMDAWKK